MRARSVGPLALWAVAPNQTPVPQIVSGRLDRGISIA